MSDEGEKSLSFQLEECEIEFNHKNKRGREGYESSYFSRRIRYSNQ